MEKVGRSVFKGDTISDDLLILSCEEDYASCVPFLEKGQKLFHSALKTCYLLKIKNTMFCICRGNGVQFRTVAEWHSYSEAGVSKVIFFVLLLVLLMNLKNAFIINRSCSLGW